MQTKPASDPYENIGAGNNDVAMKNKYPSPKQITPSSKYPSA
jgi:hypothetical protein